jgi:hypothetical protein
MCLRQVRGSLGRKCVSGESTSASSARKLLADIGSNRGWWTSSDGILLKRSATVAVQWVWERRQAREK